jgi:hypothetical protein
VTTLDIIDAPWRLLAERVADLRVRVVALGAA